MNVVTFYSYKGGVGRTFALVNVAAQLAQTGRRVLMVDFDLEAPGLHTFNLTDQKKRHRGIVEYVSEYLSTGSAPKEIMPFVQECAGIGANGGKLWMMPAGESDDGYGNRFHGIDWRTLYASHHGFALIENLKAQWKAFLEPDYVLIDSRTGHTDIGGICTRQLPDTVVLLFFPNDQNRRGLTKIVRDVRSEREQPRGKSINLIFVVSNVPSLDDAEGILASNMARFNKDLEYTDAPLVINHYPSLELLRQDVFTRSKPTTKLAEQYRALAKLVAKLNPEDPEGAEEALSEIRRDSFGMRRDKRLNAVDAESRLAKIEELHSTNAKILFSLAEIRRRQGKIEESCALFQNAESAGCMGPNLWLAQAECNYRLRDFDAAGLALNKLLDCDDATEYHVRNALNIITQMRFQGMDDLASRSAIRSLDTSAKQWIADALCEVPEGRIPAIVLLRNILDSQGTTPSEREEAKCTLVLCEIGVGHFAEATTLIRESNNDLSEMDVADLFNYAMANWGYDGTPDPSLFQRVIEKSTDRETDANYKQCLALAARITGDREGAKEHLHASRQLALSDPTPDFSCWRYLKVPVKAFLDDLDEMATAFDEDNVVPAFMKQQTSEPCAL